MLPPYLLEDNNPLKNKPVAKTPLPTAPMTDNYAKYSINLKLPGAINLSNVKILYSKEKEDEDEER